MKGINLKRVYPKVNRNDYCPCGSIWEDGSRKKFKHCCVRGEWPNDLIDVHYGLIKRDNSWIDLNEVQHSNNEAIINKEDERIF